MPITPKDEALSIADEERKILASIRGSIEKDEDAVEDAVLHELPQGASSPGSIKLKKDYNIFSCISAATGTIIGIGLFVGPRIVVKGIESLLTSLILYACYGALAIVGALVYADIGTAFCSSGGDYTYMLQFYGTCGGLAYQIASNLIIVPIFRAVIALWTAVYLLHTVMKHALEEDETEFTNTFFYGASCLSVVLLMLTSLFCCLGTRVVRVLSAILLGVKAITLAVLVGVCIRAYRRTDGMLQDNLEGLLSSEEPKEYRNPVFIAPSLLCPKTAPLPYPTAVDKMAGFTIAIYGVALSYSGWTSLTFITEELKDSRRTLKLGLLITAPVVAVINVAVILCYIIAFYPFEIEGSVLFPTYLYNGEVEISEIRWIMPLLIGLSLLGTLLSYSNSVSRIPFVGARRGHFPKTFSLVHVKSLTPIPAIVFQCLISILYITFGVLLLDILLLTALYFELLFSALVTIGFVQWRIQNPKVIRNFRVPLFIPIIYSIITLGILILPFASLNWSFTHSFRCSWLHITCILIGAFLTTLIALLSFFLCVRVESSESSPSTFTRIDAWLKSICQELLSLDEEDYSSHEDDSQANLLISDGSQMKHPNNTNGAPNAEDQGSVDPAAPDVTTAENNAE